MVKTREGKVSVDGTVIAEREDYETLNYTDKKYLKAEMISRGFTYFRVGGGPIAEQIEKKQQRS